MLDKNKAEDRVRKRLDELGMVVFAGRVIVPIDKAVLGTISLGNFKSVKKNRPVAYIRSWQSASLMKMRTDAHGRAVGFYDAKSWDMGISFAVIREKDKGLVFETAKKLCTRKVLGGCDQLVINIKEYSSKEPYFLWRVPIIPTIRRYFYIEYSGSGLPKIEEYI
ncbi:MAG: hypothetical protein WC449_01870 [Candidatus Paceibacterota bacterium]